jgi:hypothetical protein
VPALAEAAKGIDRDVSLLRCDRYDLKGAIMEQKLKIGTTSLPLATFDDEGQFYPVTAESSRTGAAANA